MKIYLVRHGQTLFNKKGLVQGWCDSPLTDLGIRQAKNVGESLSSIKFTKGYSSTCERAVDTLDYILQGRDIVKQHLKGLKEMNFGYLEGDNEQEVFKDFSDFDTIAVNAGGESSEQVEKRMFDTLETIAKENEGNVLVVGHGGSIFNFLMYLDPKKMEDFLSKGTFIQNCSVTILDYSNNKFNIEVIGDTSYAKG